jgi:hypothetical protein
VTSRLGTGKLLTFFTVCLLHFTTGFQFGMGDHFFRVTILSKNAKYLETKVNLKLYFKLSGKCKIIV